jgi:hypothetical protein
MKQRSAHVWRRKRSRRCPGNSFKARKDLRIIESIVSQPLIYTMEFQKFNPKFFDQWELYV